MVLGCQASIEFPYSAAGAGLFFPEAYEAFAAAVDATGAQPGELLGRYAERLASEDAKASARRPWDGEAAQPGGLM